MRRLSSRKFKGLHLLLLERINREWGWKLFHNMEPEPGGFGMLSPEASGRSISLEPSGDEILRSAPHPTVQGSTQNDIAERSRGHEAAPR